MYVDAAICVHNGRYLLIFSLRDYSLGGGGGNEGGGGMAVLDAAPLILAYTNIFLHAFCPAGSRS